MRAKKTLKPEKMGREIGVLIFDNANILDISGPVQAFHSASTPEKTARANTHRRSDSATDNTPRYTHRFLSLDGESIRTSCGMKIMPHGKITDLHLHSDLLIPGGIGVDQLLENRTLQHMLKGFHAHNKDRRLISICSGALILAASGVLDGREATTHWSREQIVKERFPNVNWQLNTIYTKSDQIYTSAGVSTGIDLAMAIIEEDHGTLNSLDVAQELVVYLRRNGGQKQFSDLLEAQKRLEPNLLKLVDKISTDLSRNWTLSELSKEANMTPRTLDRHFNQALGSSPVQFVELTRLNQARVLLAKGISMKQVASLCGFGDLQKMRRSFLRNLGITTTEYLQHFGPS
ncbi:GlxA family transcriptional regulator [Kiloniella sp. EL199]|uniref:GlxA family transcriptional regulator n=1 Tax=Kiloniella sp. EL199 TaxID=2107581 RepID=UPI000EA39611|nr:DJ-1/PfpI family protein [Kiloniella sp. EL199]